MSCIAFYIYLGSCRGRLPGVGGGGGGLGEGEGDGQEAQDPSPAAAVLGALHKRAPTADNAAVCTQCIAHQLTSQWPIVHLTSTNLALCVSGLCRLGCPKVGIWSVCKLGS